jgi:hypothetical protein
MKLVREDARVLETTLAISSAETVAGESGLASEIIGRKILVQRMPSSHQEKTYPSNLNCHALLAMAISVLRVR